MINSTKKYFTIEEALSDIKNTLENGYDEYLCDLHNEVFNTDYYIIGTYEAQQALNQYDVWQAFEEIQEYENDHFGKVLTDISNPEHVANMLYYLKGQEAIALIQENNELFNNEWNSEVTKDTAKSLIATIDTLLDENLKIFLDNMNWVAGYNEETDKEKMIEIYNSVGKMGIDYFNSLGDDDNYSFDVNLHSLIENMFYNGLSTQEILDSTLNDFTLYYCEENEIYVVIYE